MAEKPEEDDVVKAISTLISALGPLDHDARIHVLEFVLKRLRISLTAAAPANRPDTTNLNPTPPNSSVQAPPPGAVDIRSFAAEKNPKTLSQKLAVVRNLEIQCALAAVPGRRPVSREPRRR
jgi:hypothetical protein